MKRFVRTLGSVDEVVDALGGPTAVGDYYGIGQAAVSNWKLRQSIPSGWHLRIYLRLRKLGYRVKPSVFELEGDEDVAPFRLRRIRRRAESRAMV